MTVKEIEITECILEAITNMTRPLKWDEYETALLAETIPLSELKGVDF